MKELSHASKGFVLLMVLGLMPGCLFSSDDEDSPSTPTAMADVGETPATPDAGMEEMREMNERVVRRSPATSADEPAHRQTRRSPAPDQQRRRGDGPEAEPCEAESLISSDGPGLVFRNLAALGTHMPLSAALAALSTSGGGNGTSDAAADPLAAAAASGGGQSQDAAAGELTDAMDPLACKPCA